MAQSFPTSVVHKGSDPTGRFLSPSVQYWSQCRLLENNPRHLALGGFATRRQCVTLCSSGAKVTGPIKGPFSMRSSTENKFRLHMHTTNAKTSRATVLYTKASKAITQCHSFELGLWKYFDIDWSIARRARVLEARRALQLQLHLFVLWHESTSCPFH